MSAAAVTPARGAGARARATHPRSALWALTRAEGRRLLRHPLFLLGMAFSTAILVIANGNSPAEGGAVHQEIVDFLAGACFQFVGAGVWTFLVTFLAASRERRDAAEEFYAGEPVAPRTRTAAALLSVGFAGAAAAALVGVVTLVLLGPDGAHDVLGERIAASPVELAQGPLYVVLAGVLGVALGTWTRHVAVALLPAILINIPPMAQWFMFDSGPEQPVAVSAINDGVPAGWNLLAMAGLVALAVAVAMMRHDQRFRVALLAGAGLGAAMSVAIAAPTTPPNSGIPIDCAPSGTCVGSPIVAPARGTPARGTPARGTPARGTPARGTPAPSPSSAATSIAPASGRGAAP